MTSDMSMMRSLDEFPVINEPQSNQSLSQFPIADGKPQSVVDDSTGAAYEVPDGLFNRISFMSAQGYKAGDASVDLAEVHFRMMMGDDSSDLQTERARLKSILEVGAQDENYFVDSFRAVSQQIPNLKYTMGNMIKRGAQGTAGGAMIGAAVGATGFTLGPVGAATTTGGAISGGLIGLSTGLTGGAAEAVFKLESADIYGELIDLEDAAGNKINPQAARTAAMIGALPSTGVQLVPVGLIVSKIPGANLVLNKIGAKAGAVLKIPTTRQATIDFAKNISVLYAAETGAEVSAEAIKTATVEITKQISDEGNFDPATADEIAGKLFDTFIETTKSAPIMGVTFSTPKLVSDVSAAKKAAAKAKEEQKQIDIDTKAAEVIKTAAESTNTKIQEIDTLIETATEDTDISALKEQKAEVITQYESTLDRIQEYAGGSIATIINQVKMEAQGVKIITEDYLTAREAVNAEKQYIAAENKLASLSERVVENYLSGKPDEGLLRAIEKENVSARESLKTLEKMRDKGVLEFISPDLKSGRRNMQAKLLGKYQKEITASDVATVKAGARRAEKVLSDNIDFSKVELRKSVSSVRIPDKHKINFLNEIESLTDSPDVRVKIRSLEKKLQKIIEKPERDRLKKIIDNSLSADRLKPLIQSGRKKGKYGADVQGELDKAASIYRTSSSKESRALAYERLTENTKNQTGTPLENALLQIKAFPEDATAEMLEFIAAQIEALQKDGRGGIKSDLVKRREVADEYIAEIEKVAKTVFGKNVLQRSEVGVSAAIRKIPESMREVVALLADGYEIYIERMIPEKYVRDFEIWEEITLKRKIQEKWKNITIEGMKKAFNTQDAKTIRNIMDESDRVVKLGLFENKKGELINLERSRSQARYLYGLYLNDTVRDNVLLNKKGNAYTPDMLAAIFSILKPEDKAFVNEIINAYADFYEDVNPVYRKAYGIDLGRPAYYTPLRIDADQKDVGGDQFLSEQLFRKAIDAGGGYTKKRIENSIAPIIETATDIGVLNGYIERMSHFVAFREKSQFINDVFGNARARTIIKKAWGSGFFKDFQSQLEDVFLGGEKNANTLEKVINTLNRNFSPTVLGFKAKIGVAQLSSYFSYAEFVPKWSDLANGTRHFFKHPKQAIDTLSTSLWMQDRGSSPDVDLASMGQTFSVPQLKKLAEGKQKWTDLMLIFTKWGDRATLYSGGWSVYRFNALKQLEKSGLSPDAAMKKFDQDVKLNIAKDQFYHNKAINEFTRASSKRQQPNAGDVDKLSYLQKTSPLARGLGMFMSAPIAQFQGEVRVLRGFFYKKDISAAELGKALLIYHVIVPQVYTAIANGIMFGEFSEEDQMNALVFGSLSGIPIMGDVVNYAARTALGLPVRPLGSGEYKWASVLGDTVKGGVDIYEGFDADEADAINEAIYDLGLNTGQLLGVVPKPIIENFESALEDLEAGEIKPASMKMFGFPRGMADDAE